jgi:quercetin 2,3-dioxygenase
MLKKRNIMSLKILQKKDLPLGGFAGLKEHRLIVDEKIGGSDTSWNGIGNFIYLADAQFMPNGETGLHPHKEIDVISLMVDGRIIHEGSLEHGKSMTANQAQAQRAGSEGFQHNEINPDDSKNRMLQLWALPEESGGSAQYKFYNLENDKLTRIYGGEKNQEITLDNHTIIEAGLLGKEKNIIRNGNFIAYVVKGGGSLNNTNVVEGDLVRGENLDFISKYNDTMLVVVTVE